MTKTFKFALVATLLLVVGCAQIEGGGNNQKPETTLFEVVEFTPAPGQFINEGYIAATAKEACDYAEQRLRNGYYISLGGFGGYVVVKFNEPIINTGDYDFGIYGNSFSGSSEPGVVWVSQDANENGLADDEWFELYGSESEKDGTIHGYSITYSRTDDETKIAWRDNRGASGTIERNSSHCQDYFPAWIADQEYTLSGTLLPDNSEWCEEDKLWKYVLHAFEWGYADNFSSIDRATDRANRFRIGDAHTISGEAANLSQIDFVKVQSATNVVLPAIGEISTEVCGFVVYNMVE